MIFGYIRVSTADQSLDGQKNLISRYCMDNKLIVDDWLELEMSSQKTLVQRRLDELFNKLSPNDIVVVSELSRLGRSIKETLNIIETIVEQKQARLIMLKQNLDLNPGDRKNMTNKVLITIFSMLAELERDFISERTKEGLRALVAKGVHLGKPKGTIQKSMYDNDKDKILHLYNLGVPLKKIIETHLKYGKYISLKNYIDKQKTGKHNATSISI